jgi:hypothetical protein
MEIAFSLAHCTYNMFTTHYLPSVFSRSFLIPRRVILEWRPVADMVQAHTGWVVAQVHDMWLANRGGTQHSPQDEPMCFFKNWCPVHRARLLCGAGVRLPKQCHTQITPWVMGCAGDSTHHWYTWVRPVLGHWRVEEYELWGQRVGCIRKWRVGQVGPAWECQRDGCQCLVHPLEKRWRDPWSSRHEQRGPAGAEAAQLGSQMCIRDWGELPVVGGGTRDQRRDGTSSPLEVSPPHVGAHRAPIRGHELETTLPVVGAHPPPAANTPCVRAKPHPCTWTCPHAVQHWDAMHSPREGRFAQSLVVGLDDA